MTDLDQHVRNLRTPDGQRTTMRLDARLWRAIDQLAAAKGQTWQDWVNETPSETPSRAADVRRRVIGVLLTRQLQAMERPNLTDADSPVLVFAKELSDRELKADLESDDVCVEDTIPYRGFTLHAGSHQGTPSVWIENGIKGEVHVRIPMPQFRMPDTKTETETEAAT